MNEMRGFMACGALPRPASRRTLAWTLRLRASVTARLAMAARRRHPPWAAPPLDLAARSALPGQGRSDPAPVRVAQARAGAARGRVRHLDRRDDQHPGLLAHSLLSSPPLPRPRDQSGRGPNSPFPNSSATLSRCVSAMHRRRRSWLWWQAYQRALYNPVLPVQLPEPVWWTVHLLTIVALGAIGWSLLRVPGTARDTGSKRHRLV
jgi:hypothetical protein